VKRHLAILPTLAVLWLLAVAAARAWANGPSGYESFGHARLDPRGGRHQTGGVVCLAAEAASAISASSSDVFACNPASAAGCRELADKTPHSGPIRLNTASLGTPAERFEASSTGRTCW
jgi:hypothetical protein